MSREKSQLVEDIKYKLFDDNEFELDAKFVNWLGSEDSFCIRSGGDYYAVRVVDVPLIIPPGATVREVMEAQGISQEELIEKTGFSRTYVKNVIIGRTDISDLFAEALESVLGAPKSFWLNLQKGFDAKRSGKCAG